MLSDKINGLPINSLPISRVDSPPISSFEEKNSVSLINKQGNILSFDQSRRNSNSSAMADRDRSENSSSASNNRSVAYNNKNASTELDKRRAELAAMIRAAEARVKEIEEKCEQAEGKLELELKERLLAEQRLREIEATRRRQLAPTPIEPPQTRTATWAQGTNQTAGPIMAPVKTVTPVASIAPVAAAAPAPAPAASAPALAPVAAEKLLREADDRAKVTEAEIQTLMAALVEAEQKRAKAEALAQAATDKAREFESEAESARVELSEVNRKLAEAEGIARVAEEKARTIEALIVEAEAAGRQATERSQTIESELQYEINQRIAAEQRLIEFEDELGSYLELDWSKSESELGRSVISRGGPDEIVSQFHAQVDSERRARREAEESRLALEHKMREMEKALHIAEENNRQIAALSIVSPGDASTPKKRKGSKHELKFVVYGMAISLLVIALIGLIAVFFIQK